MVEVRIFHMWKVPRYWKEDDSYWKDTDTLYFYNDFFIHDMNITNIREIFGKTPVPIELISESINGSL